MLNFGLGEIGLVVVLALVVVGPDRLPEMVRFLGRQYGKLLRASNELRQAFVLEAERSESQRRSELLKTRREQARARADAVRASAKQANGPGSPTTAFDNDTGEHGLARARVPEESTDDQVIPLPPVTEPEDSA